nr:MFS transporter [Nocardioidaceae bacterium]
ALHELLLAWLPRLDPAGRAVLVVGKNLGADSLQRWLSERGYRCARLAAAKGFRVLEARLSAPA